MKYMGMTGLDRRFPLVGAMPRMLEISLTLEHQPSCKKQPRCKSKGISFSVFYGERIYSCLRFSLNSIRAQYAF